MVSERRAALDRIAAYHEACLAELVGHVGQAVDRYRGGEIDVQYADRAMYQYHRAARELWKFCFGAGAQPEFVADFINEDSRAIDWWSRGAPRDAVERS